jgi:hypothetical protein
VRTLVLAAFLTLPLHSAADEGEMVMMTKEVLQQLLEQHASALAEIERLNKTLRKFQNFTGCT